MKRTYIMIFAATAAILSSCTKDIDFDACGQIDAIQVTVSAESNGRLLALDVMEGDRIAAGQMLGAVDSTQTVLQIEELQQRMEGAASRIVDIRLQSEPNVSQLKSLENDYARYSNLLNSNAATQKQVDDLRDKIEILKAQIAAQKQSWERSNAGVRSEINTYDVQLAQRRDQLAKCSIVAPVDGTVLTKYAQAGESVTTGKPLFKVADLNKMFVRAYFTTSQLSDIKLGDKVTVIPDDGTSSPKEYEGQITWISDQAEFTPKNIQTRDERADMVYAVKVSVPNDGSLRIGMFAYIKK